MRKCVVVFFLSFISIITSAQLNYQWAYSLGGNISGLGDVVSSNCLKADAAGNLFVAGTFRGKIDVDPGPGITYLTSSGSSDIFFAKLDSSGNLLFVKKIGGVSTDQVNAIDVDALGNIYLAGSYAYTVDFDPGSSVSAYTAVGNVDGFFAKYDAWGNFIFARSIGGPHSDQIASIKVDASYKCFVAGEFMDSIDVDPSASIVKLRSAGNKDAFVAVYNGSGLYLNAISSGGTLADGALSLLIDSMGRITVCGFFSGTIDFDPGVGITSLTSAGSTDIFIVKYNLSLGLVYKGRIGGSSADEFAAAELDGAGNLLLTGNFLGTTDLNPGIGLASYSSAGNYDVFFEKLDYSGNFLFAKVIGSSSSEIVRTINTDVSGNIYLSGYFNNNLDFDPSASSFPLSTQYGASDIFLAKYDGSGNFVMAKDFATSSGLPSTDIGGKAISVNSLGEIYITGTFIDQTDFDPSAATLYLQAPNNYYNGFICKYTYSGVMVWAKSFGGLGVQSSVKPVMTRDKNGNFYVAGSFSGVVDFDLGADSIFLSSTPIGSPDFQNAYFAKYDSARNLLFVKYFKAYNEPSYVSVSDVRAIQVDEFGNIYIAGFNQGLNDFDPGVAIEFGNNSTSSSAYIAKYDSIGNFLFVKEMELNNTVTLSMLLDKNRNIYLSGSFRGTADFDPGASFATLTAPDSWDNIYFAKYDSMGNYVFAKNIGSLQGDYGHGLALDDSANIYISGYFSNSCDFDPGPGTSILSSALHHSAFLAKYSSDGNYIFAKSIASTGTLNASTSYCVTVEGNVLLIGGEYTGTVDFNPGIDTSFSFSGTNGAYFSKYDINGNYYFTKALIGAAAIKKMDIDSLGTIYIAGDLLGPTDFNPGPGSSVLSFSTYDVFVAAYDSLGSYLSAFVLGSNTTDHPSNILADNKGNVYVTGDFSGSIDFNPGSASNVLIANGGKLTGFIAKYGIAPTPLPLMQVTTNVSNISCNGICDGTATVNVLGGTPPYTYTWSNGSFAISDSHLCDGAYTVTVTDSLGNTAISNFTISEPDSLTISANSSGISCLGSCTQLVANVSGGVSGGYTFNWSPVDSVSNAAINSPLACVTVPTIFTVTVTDLRGCSGSDTITVAPNAIPVVEANATDMVLCSGESVTLFVSGNSYSYFWSSGISDNQPFIPVTTSTYYVTGTSLNGCTNIDSLLILVHSLPLVNANATVAEVCQGDSITLFASGANSYAWANGINNNVSFFPSFTSTYYVTGTDVNGCINTDSINIIVHALPLVEADVTSNEICTGMFTTLFGSGANSYSWSNGIDNNVPFMPSVTSTYYLTGTDLNGCINTDSINIIVHSLPLVEANATSNEVCAGISTTLYGSGADSYTWTNGIDNNVLFIPLATTTYYVTGTDLNGCENTDSISVIVNSLPLVSLNLSSDTVFLLGGIIHLTGANPPGGIWSGTSVTASDFDPAIAGLGITPITYTYIDTNGCFNSVTDSIYVDDITSLNLEDRLTEPSIYPNPNNGNLMIKTSFRSNFPISLDILDSRGLLLDRLWLSQMVTSVNLTKYPAGLYFILINGKVYRIVKE